jgi:hypothetical protein
MKKYFQKEREKLGNLSWHSLVHPHVLRMLLLEVEFHEQEQNSLLQ